jgi:hypothetical protein
VAAVPITSQTKKKSQSDRAIAQAVSPWFSTAATRVRAQSSHVVFVVDKVALRQVFSEYCGFPCQTSFHQILHPHNHPGQVTEVASVPKLDSPSPLFELKNISVLDAVMLRLGYDYMLPLFHEIEII